MRILGIDPGFAIVGFGVIDYENTKYKTVDFGKITTNAKTKFPDRLKNVYDGVIQVIETYSPDVLAIEELFFNTNSTTAINVAQARGVIVLAAKQAGIKVYEYTPLQIKQAVAGYGRADKNQVQQMVKMFLNLKEVPKPDDTADALAVAICHANSSALEKGLGDLYV